MPIRRILFKICYQILLGDFYVMGYFAYSTFYYDFYYFTVLAYYANNVV